jgi:hypothetical protein
MPNPRSLNTALDRRNVSEQDLSLHARSFHAAAKKLAEAPEFNCGTFTDFAVCCPVVFLYRHALELHLKAIVLGDGGNFLATKPDPLSIHKTHSVSWLAQFVAQIVTALKWEPEFRCVGIDSLEDFKALVESVNLVDPGSFVFRILGENQATGGFDVRGFAMKMDAVIGLLDATADALAAQWDLRSGTVALEADGQGGGFEPPIQ